MTIGAHAKPQILEHAAKGLNFTPFDCRWVPQSARFVVLGEYPRATGCLQVYTLEGLQLQLVSETEKPKALKCGGFGASSLADRHLATGDFGGRLQLWDLDRPQHPVYSVQAHQSIVNQLDCFGGQVAGYGPPEVATCGRDGCVRVWDTRQPDAPVAALEPADADHVRDCWTVAIGNSHNDQERCVLAGYDNGDVKLFDLRANKARWEGNVGNGVCGVQFDRRDIEMNKFVVATLEARYHVYDARTQHPTKGFASTVGTVEQGATLWGVRHLPQCREIFAILSGSGTLYLRKYHYAGKRCIKDSCGDPLGVCGSVEELNDQSLSTQPIGGFDWHPGKEGLFVCSAFDQQVRVGFVTKLPKFY